MTNTPQSPEELRRLQELAELFDDDTGPSPASTPTERSTPAGGGEVLNAAKHWGRVFGRKTKELTEKAVEKTKETQDALARRAEEFKACREAAAAEQARQQQEQAGRDALAEQSARAQSAEAVTPTEILAPASAALEELSSAQELLAPVVAVEPGAAEPDGTEVLTAEEVAEPTVDLPGVAEAMEDVEALPQSATETRVADAATVQPEHSQPHAASVDSAPATASRKTGWQITAGAGVACLVLGGGIAWWVSHGSNKSDSAPTAAAGPAPALVAPVTAPAKPALAVEQAPPAATPEPVPAPVAVEAPSALPDEQSPAPAPADAPEALEPVAALPVAMETKPAPQTDKKPAVAFSKAKPVAKTKAPPVAKKPVAEKPREETQWQEKADSDMDAWAKKAGIN